MKRSQVALSILAAMLAAGAYYLYGGSSVPRGQRELVRLDPGNFADLKQEFNSASEQVRLVLMLSPT